MWSYGRYGWQKKLPAVLDRLKVNIEDPRWPRKIAYQKGICALWLNDRDRAAAEIEPIQPITPAEEDVDLLQIQIDLDGDRMGLSEKVAFFDQICRVTESRSDKLQYGGAHAVELLLAGDDAGARAKFDGVIAAGRQMEGEEPLSITAEIWFCKSLEGRAVIDGDKALLDEIVRRLVKLVEDSEALTAQGRASVLRQIGDAHRYARSYDAALACYRASQQAEQRQETWIFEAECELRRGEPDDAFRLIRSVAVDELDASERADHAFIFFYIALARHDRQSLLDARELLKAAVTPKPHFNMLRLQHIVTVDEAIEAA